MRPWRIGLVRLVVVFSIIIVLVAVIFLVDLYGHWRWISSMSLTDRARFYGQRIRFYHMRPVQNGEIISEASDRFSHAREVSEAIDHSLRVDQQFSYYFRGYRIQNGLPKPAENATAVVHIHGSSGRGPWPQNPFMNRMVVGTHASPIRDCVRRVFASELPMTVISFVLPTEGLSTINFGQTDDSLAIGLALQAIIRRYPGKLVIYGDCLGALRVDRWLSSQFCTTEILSRLIGVALTSPIPNIKRACRPFASEYQNWFLQKYLTRVIMPNIVYEHDPTYRLAPSITLHIPTLICLLEDDCLCGLPDLPDLRRRFPTAQILVVPRQSVDQSGRTIVHGNAGNWTPFLEKFAQLLFQTTIRTPPNAYALPMAMLSVDSKCTIVTALYDIQREKFDGRSFEKYKQWFRDTLTLPAPMLIFVDESLCEWVKSARPRDQYQTLIISEPKDRCPQAHNLHRMKQILQSNFQKNESDLSMQMPEYQMLMYSKFGWLQRAMKLNPFETDMFAWVDAGQSRFWSRSSYHARAVWPHPSWVRKISNSERVWLQGRREMFAFADGIKQRKEAENEKIIGTCQSVLWGTVVAGHQTVLKHLCHLVDDYLEYQLLQKGRIDNDQVTLQLIWTKYRDLFQLMIPITWNNLWGLDQYPELVPLWSVPVASLSTAIHCIPPLE